MSPDDASSNGATNGSSAGRQRRPALERSEPRRAWSNLYAPGKADAAVSEQPPSEAEREAPAADATARVVRDGYRIVEENLRRGRQVAAELRGVRREVADFAGRLEPQRLVSSWAQTLLDPALTEQVLSPLRSLLGTLSAVAQAAAPAAAAQAAAPAAGAQAAATAQTPLPLHPQERADYAPPAARILKLKSSGPGEWLADIELDGRVRRVQLRAVDGEL